MSDNDRNESSRQTKADHQMTRLTPSQAIRGSSEGSNNLSSVQTDHPASSVAYHSNPQNPRNKNRNRNRRRGAKKQELDSSKLPVESTNGATSREPETENSRGRGRGKQGPFRSSGTHSLEPNVGNAKSSQSKNKKRNNTKQRPKKKYPWRRFLPKGSVDPITLENLQTLEYPPFALCADEPYVPVPEWPVPKKEDNSTFEAKESTKSLSEHDLEALNRQRLEEQWGTKVATSGKADEDKQKPAAKATAFMGPQTSERPYNLFDGRALAYYMVSQLQFIDPLNRRDLTRPELVNLDNYLVKHGLYTGDLKVTEAYDAKGITISSAGAAATTAQGRADIMQQMAQQLLNSLFTGPSVATTREHQRDNETLRQQAEVLSLQEQYAATQRQEQTLGRHRMRPSETGVADPFLGDSSRVYGSIGADGGGFIVIDDDENPEFRGRNYFPSLSASAGGATETTRSAPGAFYTASHIATSRHAGDITRFAEPSGESRFPALPTPHTSRVASPISITDTSKNKNPPVPSKTLSKISGLVKKTDPEERQRQWEAREAARKRAMMSNLSFGVNPLISQGTGRLPLPPSSTVDSIVTEEKIQRNQAFAEALSVKPATERHYKTGWARPTESMVTLDEFGRELNAALYPKEFIAVARERMPQVLKLEKKWKAFLEDDKAASLPLNPMDKSSRAFVHQYAEYWNLKTESFDPEPKRYIHCVKLLDTHTPHPLLSDAARNWRGPLPEGSRIQVTDHPSHQSAGQNSKCFDETNNVPLMSAANTNSRFEVLGKERPRLELAPRTVPLELPPFEQQLHEVAANGFDASEDSRKQARLAEKRRHERLLELKKKVLEDAFASDDEGEKGGDGPIGTLSDDDDWGEEPDALYAGSDEEE